LPRRSTGTEYAGRGDPARTIELLWGARPRGTRGPKPALGVDAIVAAAIEIADADGLEGLSMRRVAERLGAGTMSLYRHVPGKPELLDLMVDRVAGEIARPDAGDAGWRERLERIARENLRLGLEHPWMLRVFPGRPPLGPNIMAKYDFELCALEGIGLSDIEMDAVLTLLLEYVRGAAASAVEAAGARASTGRTDDQWWMAFEPYLDQVFDPERFPVATRVGNASVEALQGPYDPARAFEFGLARLLDGVESFVATRRA
jgi:AcrR family transcriptional regulator